jgi:hypothetical protein
MTALFDEAEMRETSRAVDKKLLANNNPKKKVEILDEFKPYFIYGSGDAVDPHTGKPYNIKGCVANGVSEEIAQVI